MPAPSTAEKSVQSTNYFEKIWRSATTTFEGMAVTFANLMRKPVTVQYPDRIPGNKEFWETLPDRTRGFLEVDMDICTACTLCETNCPIDCIQILIEKRDNEETGKKDRGMTAFDIDMGKCMYCGLCVEPCPTGAIRMSNHFEGADQTLETMVFRFIPFNGFQIPYKAPKGQRIFDTRPQGQIAKETLDRMRLENHLLFDYIREYKHGQSADDGADVIQISPLEAKRQKFTSELKYGDLLSLQNVLRSVMADTDCGACTLEGAADDWDCDGYSEGLAKGETEDVERCEPGGDETKEDIQLVYQVWAELKQATDA